MKTTTRAGGRRLGFALLALGVLAAALAAPGAAAAAGGDVLWSVPLGGGVVKAAAVAVPEGPQGSVFLCGTVDDFAGVTPFVLVVKKDASGHNVWTFTWNGGQATGAVTSAAVYDAKVHCLYVVARTVDPLHGYAVTVLQLGPDGDLVWSRTISGASRSDLLPLHAAVDGRGRLTVSGVVNAVGRQDEGFLARLDVSGRILWEQRWTEELVTERRGGLAVTPAGRSYVYSVAPAAGDAQYLCRLRAYGANGGLLWTRRVGRAGLKAWPGGVCVTPDGGAAVSGGAATRSHGLNSFIEKYSAAGRRTWRRTVDASSGQDDGFMALAVDGTGNLYAPGSAREAGVMLGTATVASVTPRGRLRWLTRWEQQVLEPWYPPQIVCKGRRVVVGADVPRAGDPLALDIGVQFLRAGSGAVVWRRVYDSGGIGGMTGVTGLSYIPGVGVTTAEQITKAGPAHTCRFVRLQP